MNNQQSPAFTALPIGRLVTVMLLALALLAAFHFTKDVNGVSESGVTMALPERVGAFRGKDQPPSEGERNVLPKDTEIVKKTYSDDEGDQISAQILLSGAEKRSIHRPELCLPAQGWSIDRQQVIQVPLKDGRSIPVMVNTISRQVETSPGVTHPLTSFYCYWFVGKDTVTASHYTRVFLTSWDRIVHHKNHRWAYAAVSAPVLKGFKQGGKNPEETLQMIREFIGEMGPRVMKQ